MLLAEDLRHRNAAVVEVDDHVVVAAVRDAVVAVDDLAARRVEVDEEAGDQLLRAAAGLLLAAGGEQDHVVGEVGVADEVLGAVDHVVVAVAHGAALHPAHVAAGVGLAHRHAVDAFAGDRRDRGTRRSDRRCTPAGCCWVGRRCSAAHTRPRRTRGRPSVTPKRVEAAAAQLGRHVGRVQPGVDRALLDLLHQLRRDLAQLLDLLLVREQLALGERANGVDDHLLLVGEGEIQGVYSGFDRPAPEGDGNEKWPARAAGGSVEWAASDRVECGAHLGKDGDGAAGVHVDVHQHLLGGRQELVGGAVEHLVVDVQPLAVEPEHPRGDAQRSVLGGFAEIGDVRLDRVEAVPGGAVRVVVADVREQRIAGPAEGGEVRRLGHVVVVVDPCRAAPGLDRSRAERRRRRQAANERGACSNRPSSSISALPIP